MFDSSRPTIFIAASTIAIFVATAAPLALAQPHPRESAMYDRIAPAETLMAAETLPGSFQLEDLQQLALQNNPTLIQASAHVRAERGAAFQAGRPPNPIVGYTGDQFGTEGTAGELQGAFIAQQIVTGGKLRLSRAKYLQRARIANTYVLAQQQRVLNDVELHFYETLAAQRMVEITQRMVANAEDMVLTTSEMLNLGQANRPEMMQAEIDAQAVRLSMVSAQRNLTSAWRRMVGIVGVPRLPQVELVGTLASVAERLTWEESVAHLLAANPRLVAAREKVRHDQIAVARERVQPVPNIDIEASTGYNYETGDAVAALAVGLNLPIFNNNRGTITQALADLMHSRAEIARLELELSNELAHQFERYDVAYENVKSLRDVMIPKAMMARDMLQDAYKARRGTWPEVLDARRRLTELEGRYVDELLALRESETLLRGTLMADGLMQPPAPMDGGHIDATPDPR